MNLLLDLVILLILAYIVLQFYYNYIEKKQVKSSGKEHFDNQFENDADSLYLESINVHIKSKYPHKSTSKILPFFVDSQFHNDYRDTLTAFNNVAPSQRQLFNKSDLPVTSGPMVVKEGKHLVHDFLRSLNSNVSTEVGDYLNAGSGWDDYMPEKRIESGWEKQQRKLGLPTTLYNDPAGRAKIKLIKIDRVERTETLEQVRLVAFMILQKVNVNDQMVLRVSFVMDKNDCNADRDFFKDNVSMTGKEIMIEEIFVVGYLTDHNYGSKTNREDFYNFQGIEKGEFLDDKAIIKQLRGKYKQLQQDARGLVDVDSNNDVPPINNHRTNRRAVREIKKNATFPCDVFDK
jgi:hypothetical protein